MLRLQQVFIRCEKLQRHVKFLFSKGGMYKIYNGNLLYHGCVPLNPDGSFMQVEICGKEYCGKALYDILEYYARRGYYAKDTRERALGQDMIWYIWAGPGSPVFGKAKMATFERYFLKDKETHIEEKNSYYKLLESHRQNLRGIRSGQDRCPYRQWSCARGTDPWGITHQMRR
jgi:fructose-1,6-bisphosphatase-3